MKKVLGFAMSLLLLVTAFGSIGQSSSAFASSHAPYRNEVLGISVNRPSLWTVAEDQVLLAIHGVNFLEEKHFGPHRFDGDSDVRLGMRVGMILDATAAQLEEYVNRDLNEYTALNPTRTSVKVGSYDAVALWPMPGIEEVTHIYVAANDHLYQIVYGGQIDENASKLLGSFTFSRPTRSPRELGLADHTANTGFRPVALPEAADAGRAAAQWNNESEGADVGIEAVSGCVNFPSSKGMQTQWSSTANGNGWSWAGPSFFGEGYHQYCNRTGGSNDYYALDHSLRTGDTVYAAWSGTVSWAGWACGGFSTYGQMVIVNMGGGYYNMMAHLNSIEVSYSQSVSTSTRIGGAGGSGNGSLSYWSPHLHQVTYLNPTLGSCGPYGGQSAMPTKVQYFGNGGGYYTSFTRGMSMSW